MLSRVLLPMIGWQTSWIAGTGLAVQPRLWPSISLSGMAFVGAILRLCTRNVSGMPGRWREAAFWLRSFEFVGWYVVCFLGVPILGCLLSTTPFLDLLTLRLGYHFRILLI